MAFQRINLVPAARREAASSRRRIRLWAGALACYTMLVCLGLVAARVAWHRDDAPLHAQLSANTATIQSKQMRLARTRQELDRIRALLDANRAVGQQPDWSVLLAVLADTIGEDVVLDHCAVEPTGGTKVPVDASAGIRLELAGFGRSQLAVSQFVLRLERSTLFSRVTLLDTHREPFLADDAIAFNIECSLEGGVTTPSAP